MCYNSHTISVQVVNDVINKLKHGKTDGYSNQISDHFIHGTNKGNVFLSLLFQGIVAHGIIPDFFLLGTITPIPKNLRKSLSESSNNRGITVLLKNTLYFNVANKLKCFKYN